MTLNIQQPGPLSLLLDGGRFGYYQQGLTRGGPMDPFAFSMANRLCANKANTTVIEISMGGFSAVAATSLTFALCGAPMPVTINDKSAAMWQTLRLHKGDQLEIGQATAGLRAYLAVAGGFQVDAQFGSTATVVREGIGGLSGRPLQSGDVLTVLNESVPLCALREKYWPHYPSQQDSTPLRLRLVRGYQYDWFSSVALGRFFSSEYQVSPQSDRMGYRLQGPAISCERRQLLSEGICFGAVQITAEGQPIVMLADRQTIGGYPKLGSLLSLDAALLGQAGPGTVVAFEPVDVHQAHNLLQLRRAWERRLPLADIG